MKHLGMVVLIVAMLLLISYVRQPSPFTWVSILPLCSGCPFGLADVVGLVIIGVTVWAARELAHRR